MSALGQTRPIPAFWIMSGLPPVATELRTSRIGSFGPVAERLRLPIYTGRNASFKQPIGAGDEACGKLNAELAR